jgi:hypothetical protein
MITITLTLQYVTNSSTKKYRVFVSVPQRARLVYRIVSLQPPGHPRDSYGAQDSDKRNAIYMKGRKFSGKIVLDRKPMQLFSS